MDYYINRLLSVSFDEAVTRAKESLKAEGFGVLTEMNVQGDVESKDRRRFPRLRHSRRLQPRLGA